MENLPKTVLPVVSKMQKGKYMNLALGTKRGLTSLPPNFLEYYGFADGEMVREDPYFSPMFMLAQSWNNPSLIILNVGSLRRNDASV